MKANTNRMCTRNGLNNTIWKAKMEYMIWCEKKVHRSIFVTKRPSDKINGEWTLMQRRQIFQNIWQSVEDSVLNHAIGETQAQALWLKSRMWVKLGRKGYFC